MKKEIQINYTEGEGEDKVDYIGSVVFKRLNFSESNALKEESTDIKFFGNTPQIKVSTAKMQELAILKSVISSNVRKITYQTEKVSKALIAIENAYDLNSIENIRNLPKEVGDQLFLEFNEMNEVSEKKN